MDSNRPKGRGRGRQAPSAAAATPEPPPSPVVEEIAARVAAIDVEHATLAEATAQPTRPAGRGRGGRAPVPVKPPSSPQPTLRGSPPLASTEPLRGSPPRDESKLPDTCLGAEGGKVEEAAIAVEDSATTGSGAPGSAAKGSDGFTSIQLKPKEGRAPVIKKGDGGSKANFAANFIRVKIEENKGFFEYRVEFDPELDETRVKKYALKKCEGPPLGPQEGRVFDGQTLYLGHCLEKQITELTVAHPNDENQKLSIKIKFIKKKELADCVQFYNNLLRKIQKILGLKEMSRNFYDYRATHRIPQHKLEIWPGYVSRIDEVEDGLMLCLDASFRVLRTNSVLDMYNQFSRCQTAEHKKKFVDSVQNKIVITKYNKQCYKITDVAWDTNPLSTFERTRKGETKTLSFKDYYQIQHNTPITDSTQPCLVSLAEKRPWEKEDEVKLITLIPELCHLTGLTDEQKANFTVMKDIAEFTRVTPQQRERVLREWVKNVKANDEVRKVLSYWGLVFDDGLINLEGRVLNAPTIEINRKKKIDKCNGDFSKDATNNPCYDPIALRRYVIICTKQDKTVVEGMVKTYVQVSKPLGINPGPPGEIFTVDRMDVNSLKRILLEVADPKTAQFVMVVLPFARDDLYGAVKTHCLVDTPIPSQVILTKTLRNEKRVRSVMQKVALQINAKLGGGLWALGIPVTAKIMFVGVDAYHDPKRKGPSVHALVATMDTKCTRYFSKVVYQPPKEEIAANALQPIFCLALQEFVKQNGSPPDRIIIFRDGVSDGQLDHVLETEVQQLKSGVDIIFPNLAAPVPFTFVVVQKKINERFFWDQGGGKLGNPKPGSVLDHSVTRRYLFDFFLVSQLVGQGTVNPTHLIVLEDNSDIKPNLIQRFAYATTFMYFNWPGTVRVPAMCQYAHKLAYLAGQHLKADPHADMDGKLYYL